VLAGLAGLAELAGLAGGGAEFSPLGTEFQQLVPRGQLASRIPLAHPQCRPPLGRLRFGSRLGL